MCGRYSLALRPAQVRAYLARNMQVDEAPDDDAENAPRQSYNFAPGYHGIVYRAIVPDNGAGPRQHGGGEQGTDKPEAPASNDTQETRYELKSMTWGLIPFWTKRNPNYGSLMKTINCRDDSLIENRGMWTTMKQRKRCIVVAQGFYEWLKKGKEKVPHYTKRKDGQLMCFAGLWDCVQYEGSDEKHYTYAIITTDSNKQLTFLHDRMPVILDNSSEDIKTWLDPKRFTWSKELQNLLKPYDGELECYPVSKDVGKVGNNSPTFIIPVASSENKSNIANFFGKPAAKAKESDPTNTETLQDSSIKAEETHKIKVEDDPKEDLKTVNQNGSEDNAPLPVPEGELIKGIKRELNDIPSSDGSPKKVAKTSQASLPPPSAARKTRSAISNNTATPSKTDGKGKGSQKITNFFGK
ncbi:hypothetical protein BJ875DRAFT_420195 [Amylocarpus encephaloides]|uniref:DUF159 domain protein n=1 Tax=Amylocarpus encephaloides TaxID=45428 RepID=A0A9P7YMC0_9HELO|nr:hypothetical protein BJ875DRAFT_420195 [Amylocarpus encephaloides]